MDDDLDQENEPGKRRRISIRDDIYQELKTYSKKTGDPRNQVAAEAIKWYLGRFDQIQ